MAGLIMLSGAGFTAGDLLVNPQLIVVIANTAIIRRFAFLILLIGCSFKDTIYGVLLSIVQSS
jgi:hypothetical protein